MLTWEKHSLKTISPPPATEEMLARKCGNDEICDFLFHPLQGRATLEKISQQKYVGGENATLMRKSVLRSPWEIFE